MIAPLPGRGPGDDPAPVRESAEDAADAEAAQAPPAAPRIRVMVVDDHEVLGGALAVVLDAEDDLETTGLATTLEQAATMIVSTTPDVMLLDHRLPDGDGVAAIPRLLALRPTLKIVVLTASAPDHLLLAAIEAGAYGFLSKSRSVDEVCAAVRAAAAGESVISPELLARLLPRLHRGAPTPIGSDLTDREREVLNLLARGLSNAAIAAELVVSVHTVRNHIANLSAKLGAHSKLEALSIAVDQGLVTRRES